jgi:hypothetical protein
MACGKLLVLAKTKKKLGWMWNPFEISQHFEWLDKREAKRYQPTSFK